MKRYGLIERGKARQDLEMVTDYFVDAQATSVALRFLRKVRESYDALTENPYLGSEYISDNPLLSSLRQWRVKGFKKYVIYYCVIESARKIRIVRVLHGFRNSEAILERDDWMID